MAAAAATFGTGAFLWSFRYGKVPAAVVNKFVADLGGGKNGVATSHYLSSNPSLGALLLFFGFLVACAGAYSKYGLAALGIFILIFIAFFTYGQIA